MYDTGNWVTTMGKSANSTYIAGTIPHTSACGTQLSRAQHINGLATMGYAAYQYGNYYKL